MLLYMDHVIDFEDQVKNNVQGEASLHKFLNEVLPERMPDAPEYEHIRTREDFLADVYLGIKLAPMSIRMTPHILSSIDWSDPLRDPLSCQFIPKKSTFKRDHPRLELDSLHEADDMPVDGLVHRYTDKCLFLCKSSSLLVTHY